MDWKREFMLLLNEVVSPEDIIKELWEGDKQFEILHEYREFVKELRKYNEELQKTHDSLLFDDRI